MFLKKERERDQGMPKKSKNNSKIINYPGFINNDSSSAKPVKADQCPEASEFLFPEELLEELLKERKRVIQWRILNEASVILNSQLNSESLPLNIIKYAKKLVSAEAGMLALEEVKDNGLKIIKHYTFSNEPKEKSIEEIVQKPQGAIEIILQTGEVINRNSSRYNPDDLYGFYSIKRNLLGIPLFANRRIIGALLMANKSEAASFSQDDQELLMILGSQLGIALENCRLYEKIDKELEIKVNELELVNEKLRKQHIILEKSLEMHNQLTGLVLGGKGIEAICETLSDFVGSPVQIEDHNFSIKASTIQKTDKNHINGKELVENEKYNSQVFKLCKERNTVELFLNVNTQQYIVPIVAGQQFMGLISAIFVQKPIRQLDKVALEQGATIVALEMLKQRAAVEQTKRLKESFLELVLDQNYESTEWMHHRALQLGFNLKNSYQVITVEVVPKQEDRSRPELLQEIKDFCIDSFPHSTVITKNTHILIILSFDQNEHGDGVKLFVQLLKKRLISLLRSGTWWVTIGTLCHKIEDCHISYRNAVTSLDIMKSLNLKNRVVSYNNLGIFSLIEINPQNFAEFAKRTIGPLIVYDQDHNTQLVKTLSLFFKNNGNVLKAAREGYLNPSTVKYRLRRIQEITGLDLKETETCLQLQLALRITDCDLSDN